MQKKYCRLCWNSKNWEQATGEAARIESTPFVAQNGFGYEEWAFNYDWILPEVIGDSGIYFKYAFFEPVRKHNPTDKGENLTLLLYTRTPSRDICWVATINNVKLVEESEASKVLDVYRRRGWLDEMDQQIREAKRINDLGYDPEWLDKVAPTAIFNVKFKIEDVDFFNLIPVDPNRHNKIVRNSRYQLMEWSGEIPQEVKESFRCPDKNLDKPSFDPRRSEHKRKRSAIKATRYDPLHVKIQNGMYGWLASKYGENNISYEENNVDLVLNDKEEITFYEIKTHKSVKRCIRDAIGQLLEYAFFPNDTRADRLIVVGMCEPKQPDKDYTKMLREKYGLPIYYAQWKMGPNRLLKPI